MRTWKRTRNLLLAATLAVTAGAALAQQEGGGQEQDQKTIVTDVHRTVWTWQAKVAVKEVECTEDEARRITELYVRTRASHLDAQDYYRDEWREQRDRMLRESRRTGGVDGSIFSQGGLQRQLEQVTARERRNMARELVRILRKERADEIYPWLGGFDRQTDALVREFVAFEVDEAATMAATKVAMIYGIELSQAQVDAGTDRARFGQLRVAARDRLLQRLEPILDQRQHHRIAVLVGARPAAPPEKDDQRNAGDDDGDGESDGSDR